MSVLVQINDPLEMQVVVRLSGSYSPDVLDDVKRRAIDAYKEALQEYVAAVGVEQTPEDQPSE